MVIFHADGHGNFDDSFYTKAESDEETDRYYYKRSISIYFICNRRYKKRSRNCGEWIPKKDEKTAGRGAKSLDSGGFGGVFPIKWNQNLTNGFCSAIMPRCNNFVTIEIKCLKK